MPLMINNLNNRNKANQISLGQTGNSNWYSGDQPTSYEIYGRIGNISKTDMNKAADLFGQFSQLQQTAGSKYYNAYSKHTNRAVDDLAAYGIDANNLSDSWFSENQGFIRDNLIYSGTANTPSKPGAKATDAQKIAYSLYQFQKSEQQTKSAESEWQKAMDEAKYWAAQTDRNYTDDEILNKVNEDFAKKYPTLAKMKASADSGYLEPMEFNRAIGYSEDALRGAIWEGRNQDYNGDITNAIINSAMGNGYQWQKNAQLRAKLDPDSNDYSPFSVGSTMEKERVYFGVSSFSKKWIEDNRYRLDSQDEEEKKMYQNVLLADQKTDKLETELQDLYADIYERVSSYSSNPERLINRIKNSGKYDDLLALDDEMKTYQETRTGTLTDTTRAIDYRWQDVEQFILDRCAEEEAKNNKPVNSMIEEGMQRLDNLRKKVNDTWPGLNPEKEEENPASPGASIDPNMMKASTGVNVPMTPRQKEEEIENEKRKGQSPIKTPEEYIEEMQNRNLATVAPTVYENGTDAEKVVFESGNSTSFDSASQRIADINVDEQTSAATVNNTLTEKTASLLPNWLKTKRDYETLGANYDKLKAENDKYKAEIAELEAKQANDNGMTTYDVKAVNNLLNDEQNAEELKAGLENGSQEAYEKLFAMAYPYEDWGVKWRDKFGAVYLNDGRDRLGEFVADHPKLEVYKDWILNGKAGESGFTTEDEDRLNELYDTVNGVHNRPGIKDSDGMDKTLADMEAQLESGKDAYDQSIKEMNSLIDEYGKMYNVFGDKLDLTLVEGLFAVDEASAEFTAYPFTMENPYVEMRDMYWEAKINQDEEAMDGLLDDEQLAGYATQTLLEKFETLRELQYVQDNMDALGLQYDDTQKKYLQQEIDVLQKEINDASDFLTMMDPEFHNVAQEGYHMTEEEYEQKFGQPMSDLTRKNIEYIKNGKNYNVFEYVAPFLTGVSEAVQNNTDPFFQQFYGFTAEPISTAMAKATISECWKELSADEKDGYWYRLYNEGEDSANAYLKNLVNSANGMAMKRAVNEAKEDIDELTNQSGAAALLGYFGSFGLNAYGGIHDAVQRVKYDITGQRNWDPNGASFLLSDVSEQVRQNAIEKYTEGMSQENKETFTFFANALTSAVDSYISSRITGGLAGGIAGAAMDKLESLFSKAPVVEKLFNWLNDHGNLVGGTKNIIKEWVSAMPMAVSAADKAMRQAILKGADEDQQRKIWEVTFLAESMSEAITVSNINDMLKRGADGELKGMFSKFIFGGLEEALGEGINEYWEQNADTLIMGAKSEHAQMVERLVANGVPRKTAENIADAEMWKSVAVSAASGFVSSTFSQGTAAVAGNLTSTETNYQRESNREADIAKIDTIGEQGGKRDSAAVISSVLRSDLGRGGRMTINDARKAKAINAASQLFVSRVNGGSAENARSVMKSLLSLADSNQVAEVKDAVTYATLTKGNGNRVLLEISTKANDGTKITKQDIQYLLDATNEDQTGPNAKENAETYIETIKTHRVAMKEMEMIAKDNSIAHRIDDAAAAVKKSQANRNAAIENKKKADAYVEAIVGNLQAIAGVQTDENGTATKENNAQIEQGLNELEAAVAQQQRAELEVQIANEKLDHDVQWLESEELNVMNDVRQEAQAETEQEMAAEEEQVQVEAQQAAKEAAQAKAQAEVNAEKKNAGIADANGFVKRFFPNATDDQKKYIRNAVLKAIQETANDKALSNTESSSEDLVKNRRKILKDIAEKYRVNITVKDSTETDENGNAKHFFYNGNYEENANTIVVDSNTSMTELMWKVMGHEMFHMAKASNTFKELADAVLKLRYGDGVTWQGVLDSMKSGSADSQVAADLMVKVGLRQMQYEQKDSKFGVEDALEEVVADEMGNILNGDMSLVNRLVEEKPNIIRRIISAIKQFIRKSGGMEGEWLTNAQKTVDMLENALLTAQKNRGIPEGYRGEYKEELNNNQTSGQGTKYSLPQDAGVALASNDQGEPLAQEFTGGTVAIDTGNSKYSLSSFDEKEQARVRESLLKSGLFTKDQVDQYMTDALGIAAEIAKDRVRLDFEASDNQVFLKPNNDYYFTLDASTLCAKRLLYQGTFDYVQHALPDEVFTPEDLIDLVNIMADMGYETPCGICYVESRRRWLDTYAQEFLETVPKDPKSFVDKRFKKSSDEEKTALIERLSGEMPSIDDLTTSDGLERLRNNDPLMYKAFVAAMNAKGTMNPKVVQLRTEYRGDIAKNMTAAQIQKVKDIGGLRIQSFSDFETPHLLDMMQAVMDMSAVGLTSQAYTKVPNFAWVFGDTGIKINLSLIGKGTGLDENGNLVFDNREGINFDEAMKLRDRYGSNVGTILVGINDDHIVAAMGDPHIDFIIPFHKSGWSDKELKGIKSLQNYHDYTDTQNERLIIGTNDDGSYETESFKKHQERTKEKLENFQPVGKNGYWNFNESGQWNAEKYLEMCAKAKRVPKFSQFLVDNGDGSFSLPQGTDKRSTAIREGYWKTLIDFKMYENDSYGRTTEDGTKTEVKGAKQRAVTPNINMNQAYRVMNDYKLGRQMPNKPDGTPGKFLTMESNNSVPVATDAADEYIELIKRKRAGIKPEGPNPDVLEADLPEDAGGYVNPRASVFGASQAPAVLGNTESQQTESYGQQRNAMAIDAETGETVNTKYSLPSDVDLDKFFDEYIENMTAEELDELAQELFGIPLGTSSKETQTKVPETSSENEDADFVVSSARDLYNEAIANGDLDAARSIVGKIAKAAGYTVRGTHRTNAKFNTFEKSKQTGKNGKALGDGFYVASGEGTEYDNDAYGKNRMVVYVNPGNVFDIQKGGLSEQEAKDVYDKYFAPYHPNAVGDNPYTDHVIASLQKGYKVIDYIKEAAENANTTTDEVFKWLGYDSVKDGPQYCVFDSSQIKLADPVTYDDEGNPIPIEDRYNQEKRDIRYSLPMDANYLAAVERGEMDEAQEMVDEAAEKAGYTIKGYHGTSKQFTVFDKSKAGQNWNGDSRYGPGLYFAYDSDTALKWTDGMRVIDAWLKIDKPLDLRGETPDDIVNAIKEKAKEKLNNYDPSFPLTFDQYRKNLERIVNIEIENPGGFLSRFKYDANGKMTDGIREFLSELGYDGILADGEIVVFDPSQVKSADPVVYDDQGNVIPLSDRFQKENNDIRYSLPSDDYLGQQIRQYLENGGSLSEDTVQNEGNAPVGPQRQFGHQTAQNSGMNQEVKDYLYEHSDYTPDSNKAQIDRAEQWVRSKATESDPDGYNAAVDAVTAPDFNYMSADGQARMLTVMSMAAVRGGHSAEARIADAFNKQGTDLGRQLQARKIFRLMTPYGRRSVLQGMADNINAEYSKKGSNRRVGLSEFTLKAAERAKSEEDFDKVRKAAKEELAEQMPANWKEKLTGWRMLSMLGNPRTHVRNVLGNFFFMPIVGMKNKVGALAEILSGQKTRTKTLGLATREARAFAKQDALAMRDQLTGEAKYKEGDEVGRERKTWGQGNGIVSRTLGKALQKASDINSKALETEDWIFLNRHYRNALAGYMTANNLTAADMTGATLDNARDYATQEAQKATYRDANELANMLSKWGRSKYGFVVNAVLPFKKTPANILKRGLEYSGAGLIKSLTVDAYHMKQYMDYQNGKLDAMPEKAISPNQWIDKMSAGLTGTGIMALGAFLSAIGAIKVSMNDDDDEFDKLRGSQNYSIELFGHDVSMTIDWAAPMSMPLFVGAAMYETASAASEGKDVDVGALAESMLNITEPIFNLSMLDGVNSLLDSASYGEGNAITKIGEKILTNYASSYVPTIVGQTARTIDTTRRKSYVESGASLSTIRYAWEQIENKIPFLSKSNIPYRNAWGETDESSTVGAALENFLSPAYFNDINDDAVTDELERLYNSVSDDNKSAMIPKMPTKKVGKEALNAQQYDQLTVDRGQTAKKVLAKLMQTPEYLMADNDTKAEMVKDIWTYADQTSKNEVVGYKMDSWVSAAQQKGDPVDAVIDRAIDRNRNAQKTGYGKELTSALGSYNLEGAQTAIAGLRRAGMAESSIKSKVTEYYKPIYQEAYLEGDWMTMDEIEEMLDYLDDDIRWKYNDWLKNLDKDEEEEEEAVRDTGWLNRNR